MLVLSRKSGERIAIGGEIQLQVLEVSGNRVRLGIIAPEECRIMRAERLPPKTTIPASEPPRPGDEKAPLRPTTRKIRAGGLAAAHSHSITHQAGSLPVRG